VSAVVCAPQWTATSGGSHERLGDLLPLRDRKQNPLTGRPEGEDAVEAAVGEEVDIRRDRVEVERRALVAERRHGGGDSARQHAPTLRSRR
jgi:hypothetical protein